MGTVHLEVVGGWTRPQLLLRLLQVIDAPFQVGPKGLHERGTGAVCQVTMRGPDPALPARLRAGEDPRDPSILATDWPDIDSHHSVLRVHSTATEPRRAAAEVLRCGASLVNAGGVAVWCVESGVAHAGTKWLRLAEAAGPADPLPVLVQAWARWPVPAEGGGLRTCGLAELGLHDLLAPSITDETVADAVFEDLVTRMVSGAGAPGVVRALGREFVVERTAAGLLVR